MLSSHFEIMCYIYIILFLEMFCAELNMIVVVVVHLSSTGNMLVLSLF